MIEVNITTSAAKLQADLRAMVFGAYDLQMLRMQSGLRLCANFRAKLSERQLAAAEASDADAEDAVEEGDDSVAARAAAEKKAAEKEAKKITDLLRDSHKRLTDGVARNRTLPTKAGFVGDELISTFSELVLVDYYIGLEKQEEKAFRQLVNLLDDIPIYRDYLSKVVGVGPAMAGVIIAKFDVHKARHVSSMWKFAGLDVGPDGRGRSRRQEHLVEREYTNKAGDAATRMSVTYDPWLKTKLMGVLAGSFLRSGSPWRKSYDNYKHRLTTDPSREKVTVVEWKKRRKAGEDVGRLWTPGRINNAAKRYMVKQFLADLWTTWRTMEGLPVTAPYHEAVLGHVHGGENGRRFDGPPQQLAAE